MMKITNKLTKCENIKNYKISMKYKFKCIYSIMKDYNE